MPSWGLAINSKGIRQSRLNYTKQEAKEVERQLKQEAKADAYWKEVERKKNFREWKEEASQRIKLQSDKKRYEQKLKEKYGLLSSRKKGRPVNSVKQFQRFNKQISSSKIIPRNVQDQFAQRQGAVIPVERQSERWNPFAHRSEMEVYGDEGLTLFDGDKRADDNTGGLFGFGKRRS